MLKTLERHADYNRFQKFKILKYSGRIEQIVSGSMPCPVEWVVYPSNICGYKCGHCIMAKEQIDHRKILSKDAMMRIAGDAQANSIKCVIFSGGGDPLLNPMTNESARMCKESGIRTGINNQGYLLTDATPYNFVRYSVDAATKETYQKIHRVPLADGWERVNENIGRHADLRRNGHKIEMGLAFLITPANWHEVGLFCEWAQQFEPDFIHVRPAYLDADYLDLEYPRGGNEMKMDIVPKLKDLSKNLEEKYPNVYFRIDKFEGFWTERKYTKCRSTPLMAVTSGDGAFLVCQDRGIRKEENSLRWGDYNTQSFESIWWSKEHEDVINSIDLDKCPRCVMNGYNEIVEHGFINDSMKMDLI